MLSQDKQKELENLLFNQDFSSNINEDKKEKSNVITQTDRILDKKNKKTNQNVGTQNEVDIILPESKPFIPVNPQLKKEKKEVYKTPEGLEKRSYNFFKSKDVTKKNLIANKDWEDDAIYFLTVRGGYTPDELDTSEKVWNAFAEHMRYYDVANEITLGFDYDYLLEDERPEERKMRANVYGRLLDSWEKFGGEDMSFRKAQDYFGGVATSPSTIFSLGAATFARRPDLALASSFAGKPIKKKIATYLKQFFKKGALAATYEAPFAVTQSVGKEDIREEIKKEDFRPSVVAIETGLQITGGFLLGGGGSVIETRALAKANRLNEKYTQAKLKLAANAKVNTDNYLDSITKVTGGFKWAGSKKIFKSENEATEFAKRNYKRVSKKLEALNPEYTALGRKYRENIKPNQPGYIGSLPENFHKSLVAAALRVENAIKLQPGERITSGLHRAITEGILQEDGSYKLLKIDGIQKILQDHNLSLDEFGLIFLSDVSDAARTLQAMGQVKTFNDKLNELTLQGYTSFPEDIALETAKNTKKSIKYVANFFQNLDRAKLGAMTSQPSTTLRNNANAIFRVGVDLITASLNEALHLRNPFKKDTAAFVKYMFRPAEARIFREIYKDAFPEDAAMLFREAADVTNSISEDANAKGISGVLRRFGTKLNVLNTISDNYVKQGALITFLRRNISNLPDAKKLKILDADREVLLAQKLVDTKQYPNQEAAEAFIESLSPKGLKDAINANKIPEFHDFFTIVSTGRLNVIPKEIMDQSVQDTYAFVYQATMKGDGYLKKFSRGTNRLHKQFPFIISSFIPFPRYTANHLKTVYEYMPLINLLDLGNIGSKKLDDAGYGFFGKPFKSTKDMLTGVARDKGNIFETIRKGDASPFLNDMAKGLTGTGLLLACLEWRYRQGNTNHWWEIKAGGDKTIDGRPIYGALAPYMLASDLIYRYQTNTLPGDTGLTYAQYSKDAAQALIGVTLRRGMGLMMLDDFIELFTDNDEQMNRNMVYEFFGNVGQQFAIPVQPVKYFLGISDEDQRIIPSQDGKVNFLDLFLSRALRGAPDIPGVDVSGAVENKVLPSVKFTLEKTDSSGNKYFSPDFKYESGSGEIKWEKLWTNSASDLKTSFELPPEPAINVFKGPLKVDSPISRLIGMSKRKAKNILEKELTLLNIPTYELYRFNYDNPEIEKEAQILLGEPTSEFNLEVRMAKYLISDDYTKFTKRSDQKVATSPILKQTAPVQVSPAQRTRAIFAKAKAYIAEARAYAESRLETFIPKDAPYSTTTLKNWKKLTKAKTVLANELYIQQYNTIKADGNRSINIYDKDKNLVTPTNVWDDREYFIVRGSLTEESWNKRSGVLQEYIEQANNFAKQFKEKPVGSKRK